MNIYLAWTIAIGYWIFYPVYLASSYVGLGLLLVLRPLLHVAAFIAQPLKYLGLAIGFLCAWPFRFLARFETVYIYLGAGGLVGVICGVILYISQHLMSSSLQLDNGTPRRAYEDRPARGPTAKEYRQSRHASPLKAQAVPVMMPPKIFVHDSPSKSLGRQRLNAQTMMHEDIDSDF